MRPIYLIVGALSLASFMSFSHSASAQCVVADVSIQATIDGSPRQAEQVNEVAVDTPQNGCVGNTSVQTNRQINVGGTGDVRQVRQSQHRIQNSPSSNQAVTGPTVVVPVGVQVDVYNSAERLRQQRSSH